MGVETLAGRRAPVMGQGQGLRRGLFLPPRCGITVRVLIFLGDAPLPGSSLVRKADSLPDGAVEELGAIGRLLDHQTRYSIVEEVTAPDEIALVREALLDDWTEDDIAGYAA